MGERAKVGSLEAVEAFRSALIVYIAQARSALEEVSAEVTRTRMWLENDQRRQWEREIRNRRQRLEEAQQELFTARLSTFSDGVTLQQLAVHRARRALEEAETKLRTAKRWDRDFEGVVQPMAKQMEKLHTMLTSDMPKAVAELNKIIETLAAYTQTPPPPMEPVSTTPASETNTNEDHTPNPERPT